MLGMRMQDETLRFFRRHLLDFFRKSGRVELPWRKKNITAYEVWVSEIMLQQTQVVRVREYYTRFVKRFPTVEALSQVGWDEFLPYYAGLGYYSRGRNMLRTAAVVVERYAGRFPRTPSELDQLPGIGPYTARAIASFAYGAPVLAWDTNLRRVLGRFFLGSKDRVETEHERFFEERLGQGAHVLNAALMDFGSALCTARPKCLNCPLKERCRYVREKGRGEVRVVSRSTHRVPQSAEVVRAIVFLHERHQRYFSAARGKYVPFVLPKGYTTRAMIKQYFFITYGLVLSVRPPWRQVVYRHQPTFLIYAQILQGEVDVDTFPKSAVLEYTKKVL